MISNALLKYGTVTLFALFLSWSYLYIPQTFLTINAYIGDYFLKLRGDVSTSDNIVIIDIDESSLEKYGQWPWSRHRVADLLNNLNDAKAGIIGLDIVFSEKDKTSPQMIADKLNLDVKNLENYDEVLASTFAKTPVIGGYFFRFEEGSHDKTPMVPVVFLERGLQNNKTILEPKSVVLNIDILQESLFSSGFFNNIPDTDGIIRSVPLIMRYNNVLYPSLILEMLRIYSEIGSIEVIGDDIGVDKIKLGNFDIPTDHSGRLYVNYRGGTRHFQYISAKNILEGNFDPKDIAGKFVLVGTSAIALSDLRATPLSSVIPGVEILANVLDNVLMGDFIYKPFDLVIYDLLIIWAIIFLFSIFISRFSSWLVLPVIIISALLLFSFLYYLFFELGVIVNLFFPILAFIGTLILTISIDYLKTSMQKEYIQRIFAKKVSKSVLDDLMKHKNDEILEAHEREVTIFFSDIRGFTSISENIASSQKLVALLNRYMTPMVDIISKEEGTVDKFIGDAIMAYWNAPKYVENYTDKAVRSAIKQIQFLDDLNKDLNVDFDITLKIGIGIHSGSVTVGEMGSIHRSDYTIIGDNVNLASRIQELNKLYDTTIIITKDAKELLKDSYITRSLDIVRVRGKNNVVEIFEVIPFKSDETLESELAHYDKALKLYRSAKINEAHKEFNLLYMQYKRKLYNIYLTRCEEYIADPEKKFNMIHMIR